MSIKNLFSKEKTSRYDSDDYKTDSSRRSYIIIAVISLVLAFAVWMIAVYSDRDSHTFSSVQIQIRNGERVCEGLETILDADTVSFTVYGRKKIISALSDTSVVPYIDISEMKAGSDRATLTVRFDYDGNLTISDVSVQSVTVQTVTIAND